MEQTRNSSTGLVVVGALAVGGYFLYTKVIKPNVIVPLQVKKYVMQLRVNIVAVRFKGDNVEFDLYIQNPNSGPMTVKAIVGDVYVQGGKGAAIKIGNLDRYTTTIIKPTAETKFTFAIKLKFLSVLKYFQDIVAGKVNGQVLSFNGNININGKLFPIKESYKIA